jgi:hypothetical protein
VHWRYRLNHLPDRLVRLCFELRWCRYGQVFSRALASRHPAQYVGRRLIWPPRHYPYTLGAIFLSLVATGLFVYIHFQFGLSPLEPCYLPYYPRTELGGFTHPASNYRLLYISDGKSRPRTALEADVGPGSMPQQTGNPLPLVRSSQARQDGSWLLFREQPRSYQNKALHKWIEHWVYADIPFERAIISPKAFCCALPTVLFLAMLR